jgi:DNA-binding response OmpR family regulator
MALSPTSRADAKTILLAEDSDELRALLAAALEADGYVVAQAANGSELIDQVRRSALCGGSDRVDMVISDVRMPRMSGLTALKLIRDADLSIPILLLTAFGDLWTRAEAAEYGALLLPKPVQLSVLRAVVREQLAGAAAPATR